MAVSKNNKIILLRSLKLEVITFLCFLLMTQINCRIFNEVSHEGAREYYQINNIPRSNQTERSTLFNSYPVKKQVDIYLYAMCCRNPSDGAFLDYFLYNGENKVNEIVEAIKIKSRPMDKGVLISALYFIDKTCNCVANNPKIMEVLKLNEIPPAPNDDEGNKGWKKNYSWTLFELQQENRSKSPKIANPYSNSNTK